MLNARGPASRTLPPAKAGHYFFGCGLVCRAGRPRFARGAGAVAVANHCPARARSHFQGRGELRRRRRARRRQGRQLRPRAEAGRLPGARRREAAEGPDLRHGRHPEHAPAQAAVPRAGRAADRARRRGQQTGARRAAVPDRARRLSRRAAAQPERAQHRAPLRAREARTRRSGGRGRDERTYARIAGLHAEPAAARRSHRQLRRPEAAFVCGRAQRAEVARRWTRRGGRSTTPAIRSRSIRRTGSSPTTWQPSACSRRVRR